MTLSYWQGEAGDAYTERNPISPGILASRAHLWRKILSHLSPKPESILEVGANVGINLLALRKLIPAALCAVEPNATARARLEEDGAVDYPPLANITEYRAKPADLVFTSGVLIHIQPDELLQACKEIHRVSREWIVAIEYFSAEPRMVPYRGENDRLWTRDFGAFYLDNFPDLKPVACGFAWKRMTGLDDLTWVVLRKEKQASV